MAGSATMPDYIADAAAVRACTPIARVTVNRR